MAGPFVCVRCGFMFATKRALRVHESHPHAQDIIKAAP